MSFRPVLHPEAQSKLKNIRSQKFYDSYDSSGKKCVPRLSCKKQLRERDERGGKERNPFAGMRSGPLAGLIYHFIRPLRAEEMVAEGREKGKMATCRWFSIDLFSLYICAADGHDSKCAWVIKMMAQRGCANIHTYKAKQTFFSLPRVKSSSAFRPSSPSLLP